MLPSEIATATHIPNTPEKRKYRGILQCKDAIPFLPVYVWDLTNSFCGLLTYSEDGINKLKTYCSSLALAIFLSSNKPQ